MQYGIAADWVTSEGQDGLRSECTMPKWGPAGRAMTLGTPEARRCWNGAASGMLAVAHEALGAERRALGRNPSGGNGLDGPSAARALRSVRTARGSVTGSVIHAPYAGVRPTIVPRDAYDQRLTTGHNVLEVGLSNPT